MPPLRKRFQSWPTLTELEAEFLNLEFILKLQQKFEHVFHNTVFDNLTSKKVQTVNITSQSTLKVGGKSGHFLSGFQVDRPTQKTISTTKNWAGETWNHTNVIHSFPYHALVENSGKANWFYINQPRNMMSRWRIATPLLTTLLL